jgi:hypothetical protein
MTITMTRPAPTTAVALPADPHPILCIAVNLSGRLSIMDTGPDTHTGAALARRTVNGTVHRIALADGITAWLDGDDQDGTGELNWAATHMCAALTGATFNGPGDAPFVCGPVLFTATSAGEADGLSDTQLARLIDAHAAAEHPDADPLELPSAQDGDR